MPKKVFCVHGWEGNPEEAWWPWLRKTMKKNGFDVSAPEMPDTNHPDMNKWVSCLSNAVGKPDGDCYFVGHSLGCITILRYIESMKDNESVGGAVLIGGFSDGMGYKEMASFFSKPIHWTKIKSRCKRIISIHSDDDPIVSLKYSGIFKNKLGAEVAVVHNMGHFTGSAGLTELPVALEALLEISGKK